MATVIGRLTTGIDTINGTAADEIIQVPSSNANLSELDIIAGGGGHDVLLFERPLALSVAYARLAGMSGIEELDVTAASSAIISLDTATVQQSDTGILRITFDGDPLALDLRDMTMGSGTVLLAGTGTVTLYDAVAQSVTVADGINGDVIGGANRDQLIGGTGADSLSGGAGDDTLSGGAGADTLTGGDGQDGLSGGTGNDVLSGGAGFDLLSGGTGTNQVTGGADADAFVVTANESLTITDFDLTDAYERIDLRAFAGLTFADLAITANGGNALVTVPGGTTITLTGVASSALAAAHFIFDGDTVETMAAALGRMADFEFSDVADSFVGSAANEVFEIKGNFGKLADTDSFSGGAGIDVLRIWGADRSLAPSRLAGMDGIEIIDMTGATGALVVGVDAGMVAQSDTGVLTIKHGVSTLALDTETVTDAASVVVEGTGAVTLRDIQGQVVTISSSIAGTVSGQNKDDVIVGGALNDTISGSGGHDSLSGEGGDDILDGGDGNDRLTGGTGTNIVTGGTGTDAFVVTSGEILTITDFAGSANFERIDLRAFAGVSFSDLVIDANSGNALVTVPGGTTITLTGVAKSNLSAADFIFDGEDLPQQFILSSGADDFTGGSADDLFDLVGATSQLDATVDTINGGDGIDTLRIFGSDRTLGAARLEALYSIEVIDFSPATGAHDVAITATNVARSGTGTITVRHNGSPLALDTASVALASQVIVEGTGAVTLRDVQGQVVTISDVSAGTVSGQNKDDIIVGGALNDTISGSGGQDILSGNGGDDVLSGGAGHDTLTGGAGNNILTGGADTDRFIVSAGEIVTITDFDMADAFEVIDLRVFAGLDFAGLTISDSVDGARIDLPGGGRVVLTGIAAASVTAAMFVFDGQEPPLHFTLSDGADAFTGGGGTDVFDLVGATSQLDASVDTLNGGAGIDVLRVFGADRVLGSVRLDALNRVEVVDLTNATGAHDVAINDANAKSSDTGAITIRFGGADLALNTAGVTSASQVVIEGTGIVSLSNSVGQMLTISDAVNGTVKTGNDATRIIGGAGDDRVIGDDGFDDFDGNGGNDTLNGGAGDDILRGGGGQDSLVGGADNDQLYGGGANDILIGGAGFDLLDGGGGTNTATGGGGSDAFVVTAGETLTITDFDVSDRYERIDLRAFAGLSFADLAIVADGGKSRVTLPDGTRIILNGIAPASLNADNFVFAGDPVVLMAAGLSQRFDFQFTGGIDDFTGTNADEIFDVSGLLSNLDASDRFAGGGGTDVLRIFGDDRSISPDRLAGMSGIEVLDLTGATTVIDGISVTVDAAMLAQSDNGKIIIRHGINNLFLDTQFLDSGLVITEGTGRVTMRDVPYQTVTVSDLIGGDVLGGNDANEILGGARNDLIDGFERPDSLYGGGGDDTILGGEGDDLLFGGSGNDILYGGIGRDVLTADGGQDTLSGGSDTDSFVIQTGAGGSVLTDYDPTNFVERIDVTALVDLSSVADLTFTDEGSDVRVTGSGLNILIQGAQAADLDADDFLFAGQDPLVFNVSAGTTDAQLQQLFNDAPAGAIINIAAGTYSITQTLLIDRSDITVRGAGEGQTIFRTDIPLDNVGPTILVMPDSLQVRYGKLGTEMAEGSNQVVLPDVAALRAAFPDQQFDDFQVGDLVFLFQPNDAAFLTATGNLTDDGNDLNDWREPVTDNELDAELYYLREFRSRIVSIEDGVATLAEASPYTFEAGATNVARNTFLENVNLSGFTIEGAFEDDAGGPPDPFFFENMMPEWASIAALEFDGVRDSDLSNITILNPAAHAFKWQRAYETTGDFLTAKGAFNKDGSSGYHFLLQESFANTFTNLSSTDARHAVLFSSYNAEHYNYLQLLFANRDINFHGSPDDENTIVVDSMVQDYPIDGSTEQWRVVGPGVQGLHPNSTIDANDVTFKYARTSDRSEIVVAHVDGGNIGLGDGSDIGIGQGGNDTINGDAGNDTLSGNGGDDTLNGGIGKDSLYGGTGNDVLRGGDDNDVLYGGDGDDVINGGANGDNLFGGAGQDTFLRVFADFTDNLMDFEAGIGGDILRIRGSAYTSFSQLKLRQAGNDVILDYGPTGDTTFRNTLLADLVAENFAFDDDNNPGQDIALKATNLFAVGTNKSDNFTVARAHMDSSEFTIFAGGGYDRISVATSSLNANLGMTGTYTGVEEFDLSSIATLSLVVENQLVSQSSSSKLYLAIGDTGTAVQLDVGPLGRGKNVFIDGAREVLLTGDRAHTVKSTDRIGTNITGDTQRDVIYGGRLNDVVRGGDGNDVLFGSAGDDTIYGDAGNDTMNGGPGSDLFMVTDVGDRIAESNRWAGQDTVVATVDFRMGRAHIEDLRLEGTAILGAGNGLKNVITGNDQNNILDGGKNVDTLIGGLGDDTYLIRAPGDNAVEEVNGGIDTVKAYRSVTLDANVENLFIQTLKNAAGEGISGVTGTGNELDNLIVGNPYGNGLNGREGNDTLRGQAGADAFIFDTDLGPSNVDRILDFSSAEGDTLRLKNTVFLGMTKGAVSADAFLVGTAAVTVDQKLIFNSGTGELFFDADGSGAAAQQLVATFDGGITLTVDDILIF